MTVGVGSFKQPVRIRINPLITPASIRVDDAPFDVRVPIFGDGLPGQEVQVTLYAQRVTAGDGTKVQNEPEIPIGNQESQVRGRRRIPL